MRLTYRQHIFRDFFGDDRPSIFVEGPNSNSSDRNNNNNNAPDLSQINPDAPPSNNPSSPSPNRNNHRQMERRSNIPSFFRIFDHFFEVK